MAAPEPSKARSRRVNSANGVEEFLEPGHATIDVIGVMHRRFLAWRIAVVKAVNLNAPSPAAPGNHHSWSALGRRCGTASVQVDISLRCGANRRRKLAWKVLSMLHGRGGDGSGRAQTPGLPSPT